MIPKKIPKTKGAMRMSEKEKKILETFEKILPQMSEMEQEKLLSYGEGIAFVTDRLKEAKKEEK